MKGSTPVGSPGWNPNYEAAKVSQLRELRAFTNSFGVVLDLLLKTIRDALIKVMMA